ncbi:MAG: ergothioneine biosynthesis protein EgtB [Rhodospirillales bacterium]
MSAPRLAQSDREDLAQRYALTRRLSLSLTDGLEAEDMVIQSMPEASPTKWHLAHTSWFFETFILTPHAAEYRPFDESFGYLFNSYYEAIGARHPRPERGMLSRPTLRQVLAYRGHIDQAMIALLGQCNDATFAALEPLIDLGLHHEQQHQELLVTDIKTVLARQHHMPVLKQLGPSVLHQAAKLRWIDFPGGLIEIGHDSDGFAFDNESPRHQTYLMPFRLADRAVSNGEYLAFIENGGYRQARFWLSDGWAAVNAQSWQAPLYWRQHDDGRWTIRTLNGERPLDPAEPVCHVSYYEADAFAAWAFKRLPREAEWEVAARELPVAGNLLDSDRLHPRAAEPGAPNSGNGLRQMFGDVWEWTQSAYLPYPGFHPPEGAIGEYNGKFMSGQMVLRGGSCATPVGHVRSSYRNFFPPAARWQFSGIRLAEDL